MEPTAIKDTYQYAVLGLGGLGSAACYWLSKGAGKDVLGIEQFELDHVRGESQDHSRIIRLTYHTPSYIRFAQQAYQAWAEIESEGGEQVLLKTGELNFWPPETTLDETAYLESMAACDVPFEVLDANEMRRRFSDFRFDDSIHAIYQPDGGLVAAIKANGMHQRLAREYGATLVDNMPVDRIDQVNDGYQISAGRRIFHAEKLVIAGGPWTNKLLSNFGVEIPLLVTHEQVTYVGNENLRDFMPDRFPVWIWMIRDNFYGFPVYGAPGTKIAKDRFRPTDPDHRSFEADSENEERVMQFLRDHIPRAAGQKLYTKTCLLTHTPDDDFVLDRIPGHPNCVCIVGAAHAFKFASVIGKTLSELLIDGVTSSDISPFRFDRPGLMEPATWKLPEG
jgi:sarcosine oxidase